MNYICDIVVLTWNNLDITKQFIDSLLASTEVPFRLIIIDNASSDGTREYLLSLKDSEKCSLEVVLNDKNKGFVAGMNQGLRLSNAEYVFLVNNDLIFSKGWLEEIIAVFKSDDRIGLLNPNSNNLGLSLPGDKDIDSFADILKDKYRGQFKELPFCIGFCMALKREVIDKVGLLWEEFAPAFFEGSDYSLRVQEAGYLIGLAKAAYVLHKEHASFDLIEKRRREQMFAKSREVFFGKWGRILRVAWVVDSQDQTVKILKELRSFARKGNFITVFVRGLEASSDRIFSLANMTEHSGISFIGFSSRAKLLWRILKKKKRYDILVVSKDYIKIFNLFKFIHRAELMALDDEAGLERVYKQRKSLNL